MLPLWAQVGALYAAKKAAALLLIKVLLQRGAACFCRDAFAVLLGTSTWWPALLSAAAGIGACADHRRCVLQVYGVPRFYRRVQTAIRRLSWGGPASPTRRRLQATARSVFRLPGRLAGAR